MASLSIQTTNQALVEASKNGDILRVQQMLSVPGVNVDHTARGEDHTPLGYAAQFGHLRCCSLLLAAGANVLAIDDAYFTPLHVSLIRHHPDVTDLLLEPTVLAEGEDKTTVLHWMAAAECTKEHLLVVLERADAAAKDDEGRQAWEWAVEQSGEGSEVALLLREAADAAADAAEREAEREAEKERTTRERGWNDTVGSPARRSKCGKPPLFSANLDTQSVPSGEQRRTRKKMRKERGKITSGKSMRSDGLVFISPDNPAWVGAGRRTSMFGLPRTNSVQQNRRGTILTPASEVFNER